MGVHTHSGACGGNVAVPTFIHLCFPLHTYVDGLLNEFIDLGRVSRCCCSDLYIHFLFFSFKFGGCQCWCWCCVGVGVVVILMYLSSCGNSPASTSLHVCSNAAHPSATNW